jgi:hypothetical protein
MTATVVNYPTIQGNPLYPAPGHKFKVSELALGDVVKLFDGPFGTGIVQKITEADVTIFRPYGANHDFATMATDYSGREYVHSGRQIIPLTGAENVTYLLGSTATFEVYHRQVIH